MTVILPNSRFLHIPKTGGSWVRLALENSGLVVEQNKGQGKHQNLVEAAHPELFTFAFVRSPWTWWRSFWAYRMATQWSDTNTLVDRLCRSDDFNKFIDLVLERLPGHLSILYQRYTGTENEPIQYIGKMENLSQDLINALALAGETLSNPEHIRALAAVNVSDFSCHPAHYSPKQLRALIDGEKEVMDRYGYQPPD